ncbi:Cobalt-zinc-cadmium resistance protein CzcC [Pontiella desulfatans]|uniref:Cobalt-zinc-cadmium resistance protein CzcC n=1 Tax=Pontiella desulfatans TaxID=2750659 RepID=A0A6C2U8P3_PONDE|nr:TolC family protein [Pontiella desulfatans]VGO15871.1 Cobalt-zinc-cadmium resistance protein CzcC [Pontiella desulfatans]
MDRRVILLSLVIPLFLGGCVSTEQVKTPPPRPLAAKYEFTEQEAEEPGGQSKPLADPTGVLTLQESLASALLHNPELRAFSYDIRVAEAQALQAGLWSNPEITVLVDEYNRDGAGFDSAETSILLSQQFELGGQRRKRSRVAAIQGEIAGWDYERKRLDVFTETTLAFIDVLAATRRLEIAETLVALAVKSNEAVVERVNVGKEVPLQATKTTAEVEFARLKKMEAESELETARKGLASKWGADTARFQSLSGNLDRVLKSIPEREQLEQQLASNPELERYNAELRLKNASLSLENSRKVPDIEAAIGVKRFESDGTDALSFGIGVPLPLFNRNQGNIAASNYELAKAEAGQISAKNKLIVELDRQYGELSRAHRRVLILRSKMIPAMEEAYTMAHEGYQEGKFDVLDMLDAQRSLMKSKGDLIDALADYHTSVAAIQRIIGINLEDLTEKDLENVE